MKTRPTALRPQFAFTLIELITVIAIIAILMGLLFPAISAMRESARRTQAKTVIQNIVNATKSYSTDYGKYPPITAASNGATTNGYYSFGESSAGCAVNNNQLFNVLRAIDADPNTGHILNRRQQKYFEDKKAVASNPLREGFADGSDAGSQKGELLDPWGKQYCIILDADGDDLLKISSFFTDLTDDLRFSAVAFSMGKNGEIGGKDYKGRYKKQASSEAPDDIVSWE